MTGPAKCQAPATEQKDSLDRTEKLGFFFLPGDGDASANQDGRNHTSAAEPKQSSFSLSNKTTRAAQLGLLSVNELQ